jgi:hypothetical protein
MHTNVVPLKKGVSRSSFINYKNVSDCVVLIYGCGGVNVLVIIRFGLGVPKPHSYL